MKSQKILVLAYSDINYDPRIMKQCIALKDDGFDVSFHGVSYTEKVQNTPFKANLYFKRSSVSLAQYVQYFLLMLIFFFVQFKYIFRKPIVIVHNMPNFLVFSSFFFRLFGTKIVLDVHDDSVLVLSNTIKSRFLLFMIDKIENTISLKIPNKVMTVNRVFAKELAIKASRDVFIIHNSPEKVMNQCCYTYSAGESIKLVYIGNLGVHYGLESFIQYVDKLRGFIPLTFDIYGDGPLKTTLEKQTKELNLNGIVNFHGRYLTSEVDNILKKYHVGIAMYTQNELTSIILPVKVLEYTFNCLPTITVPLKVTTEYFGKDSLIYTSSYIDFKLAMESIFHDEIDLEKIHAKALSRVQSISWTNEKQIFIDFIRELS